MITEASSAVRNSQQLSTDASSEIGSQLLTRVVNEGAQVTVLFSINYNLFV